MEIFCGGRAVLHSGDCRDVVRSLASESVDSVVTDPPYALVSIVKRFGAANAAPALSASQRRFGKAGASTSIGPDGEPTPDQYGRLSRGFMGQTWDTGETAFAVEFWAEVYRVLKPGGHVVAASGTRTYHRLAVAIEDAGFEIRDMISWLYGSGFPKSHDVAKSIDKAARGVPHGGVDPTSPNHGKFKSGCSDDNVRGQGFGAGPGQFMAEAGEKAEREYVEEAAEWQGWGTALKPACEPWVFARKPLIGTVAANVLAHGTGALNIDGCRVEGAKPDVRNIPFKAWRETEGRADRQEPGQTYDATQGRWPANVIQDGSDEVVSPLGEPSRFFYAAKASKKDRAGSKHPTVKPIALMRYLCRLVTPPGGTVLDPFAGTGTTGEAAIAEGFRAIMAERETEYQSDIRRRMAGIVTSGEVQTNERPQKYFYGEKISRRTAKRVEDCAESGVRSEAPAGIGAE